LIRGIQLLVTKFYPPQIDAFIEILSLHSRSSPIQPKS